MFTIYVLSVFLFIIFAANGQLVSKSKNEFIEHLKPIIGAAVFVLYLSNLFISDLFPLWIGVLANLIVILIFFKHIDFKKIAFQICIFSSTLLLIFLPYFLIHGNELKVTGYVINNDTVIHALLSRGCQNNESIKSKLYNYPKYCLTGTPVGSHSVVSLLSDLSFINNSLLVVPTGLLFLGLTVFVVMSLLFLLVKDSRNHIYLILTISPFITASYFYLAIAYHGFLTQSVFVPFILAFGILLFSNTEKKLKRERLVILCLLAASAIAIYSFISVISLLFITFSYLLFILVTSAERKTLLMKFSKAFVYCLILTSIFVFLNNISVLLSLKDLSNVYNGSSVIITHSSSKGNLVSNIDLRIGTGLWFEVDYRLVNQHGYKLFIQMLLSSAVLIIALIVLAELIKSKNPLGILFISILFLSLIINLIFGSPYSTGKIQSLYLIFIPIFFVVFIINRTSNNTSIFLLIIYAVAIMISNLLLMKYLPYINISSLNNLDELNQIINNKLTLFKTRNDWAIYYNDSDHVDIIGNYYLKDDVERPIDDYELIISDEDLSASDECINTGSLGVYSYCLLK